MMAPKPVRIRSVEPLGGARVKLEFGNGETREVDLAPYLRGPVFDGIRASEEEFRWITVDVELGAVVWPNGADIDPDVLSWRASPRLAGV